MEQDRIIGVRTGKTVLKTGDRVIKMFDENYPKSAVLNEAVNQARIEETSLQIPKIIEVAKICGKWAIIQEYINGKSLDYYIHTSPENIDEYIKIMVDLQVKMHGIKPPLLNKLTDTLTRKIASCQLSATVRYDIVDYMGKLPRANCLCHGDFCPENIVKDQNGEYYLLDFSHACVGNPLADVAKSYIIMTAMYGEQAAISYLNLYCEKAKASQDDISAWLKVIAAAELDTAKETLKPVLYNFLKK